jgi:hypothetical protein
VVKGMRFADAGRSGPVQLVGAAMAAATDTPAPSVIRRLSPRVPSGTGSASPVPWATPRKCARYAPDELHGLAVRRNASKAAVPVLAVDCSA